MSQILIDQGGGGLKPISNDPISMFQSSYGGGGVLGVLRTMSLNLFLGEASLKNYARNRNMNIKYLKFYLAPFIV